MRRVDCTTVCTMDVRVPICNYCCQHAALAVSISPEGDDSTVLFNSRPAIVLICFQHNLIKHDIGPFSLSLFLSLPLSIYPCVHVCAR